jgi:hypothetical protein
MSGMGFLLLSNISFVCIELPLIITSRYGTFILPIQMPLFKENEVVGPSIKARSLSSVEQSTSFNGIQVLCIHRLLRLPLTDTGELLVNIYVVMNRRATHFPSRLRDVYYPIA